MAEVLHTPFEVVYGSFLSKITDDMYMELDKEQTYALLHELLLSAISWFEFPKQSLLFYQVPEEQDGSLETFYTVDPVKNKVRLISLKENNEKRYEFVSHLSLDEINILAIYMMREWIGQQLVSVELTRQKYSGSDFKFTSQAAHLQKLLQLQKDVERQGFHLQRLYKRRRRNYDGTYSSTMWKMMTPKDENNTNSSTQDAEVIITHYTEQEFVDMYLNGMDISWQEVRDLFPD